MKYGFCALTFKIVKDFFGRLNELYRFAQTFVLLIAIENYHKTSGRGVECNHGYGFAGA